MKKENDYIETVNAKPGRKKDKGKTGYKPGLLVAHTAPETISVDRCAIISPFMVGRQDDNNLPVRDTTVSKRHFCITQENGRYWIRDLKSRNGTFVNGLDIDEPYDLSQTTASVIRAGQTIFVFHNNAGPLLQPALDHFGIVGAFHVRELVTTLKTAAMSNRHILLAGPSGSGKELAAHAIAKMKELPGKPFVTHNAARFSSEEEATSTLFGVGARVFSNVDARIGLIEQAEDGILFLDEIHNLPERVQRSLLRVVEDKQLTRIGERNSRKTQAHFIFASNAPGPSYSVAKDLVARVRVVNVPPLSERIADIPVIFNHVLLYSLKRFGLEESDVMCRVGADHYESLCLDGFREHNVRGLIDLADRIATSIAGGMSSEAAVEHAFEERFADDPIATRNREIVSTPSLAPNRIETACSNQDDDEDNTSHYQENKEAIIAAYTECRGNISATARLLSKRGIQASRRWLTIYAERWELPSKFEFKMRPRA